MLNILPKQEKLRSALIYLAAFSLLVLLLAVAGEGLYNIVLALKLNVGQEQREKSGYFQLYAAGGSVMRGEPFGRSLPDMVSWTLSGELAGLRLNVIDLSGGRDAVYPQAVKLIRLLRYRESKDPAALIILCGHEENIKGHVRFLARLYMDLKEVSIHSLLLSDTMVKIETLLGAGGEVDEASYEYFMRAVIKAALEAGVTPVIATLPANTSVEPGGAEVSHDVLKAAALEAAGKYPAAEKEYSTALAAISRLGGKDPVRLDSLNNCRLYPGMTGKEDRLKALKAYLEYRKGRCLMAMNQPGQAWLDAAMQDDLPQLRVRPEQNNALRALAGQYQVPLADAAVQFSPAMPAGGFIDLVHPDLPGYAALGRTFAFALEGKFGGASMARLRDPAKMPQQDENPGRPYLAAAIGLLTRVSGSAPMPDLLNLAEKDIKQALKLSPVYPRAELWLRIVRIARANGNTMPDLVCKWLVTHDAVLDPDNTPPGSLPMAAEFFPEWPVK